MKKTLLFSILLITIVLSSMGQEFTVQKGVIFNKSGIPEMPRWFADSRLAFSFEETGITQVDYYYSGGSAVGSTIFLRNLWDVFRY